MHMGLRKKGAEFMKKVKNVIFAGLLLVIMLGVFGSIAEKQSMNQRNVTYFELKDIIEKKQDTSLVLMEKATGEVALTIGDTIYKTTVNPTDNNVKALLEQNNITYTYFEEQGFFEGLLKFAIPVLLIILVLSFFMGKNKNGPGNMNSMIKKNNVKSEIPTTDLTDVGGLSEETVLEVKQIIDIFQHKENAEALGIRPAKGALLHGPPGTGKTLLAKAIAKELGASFYSLGGSDFVEMFVGVGASRVRELFEEARKNKPSLIFIDEIDSVAKKRGLSVSNEERESTLNELLKQLDGVESNEDVFLIGATNRMDVLDPAILRPGRFDYKIYVGLPDLEGRKEIIHIHSKNKQITKEVKESLSTIAESTIGYSGAEIEGVFNNAAKRALAEKRTEITLADIHHALDVTILGSANRKLQEGKTKQRVAYHEAGHALVGLITKPNSVRKATIIPRGQALGFVAPIPKELELSTTSELIDRISMILAGGVAEMKKFGEHSIGVSGDVEQAKDLIGKMVDLGMRDNDFVLIFDEKEKHAQMKHIYEKALERSKDILNTYQKEWEEITDRLLQKETLSGEEIERIIHGLPEPITEENEQLELFTEEKGKLFPPTVFGTFKLEGKQK